ncbi:hypothetical protein FOMPIDRAFT_91593 [Fomitopsis schrenkii]|uniref:Uncharacterized protein n=1 Tax=Fomitopsis schrenkii TaxID=2126942 RepID=S8FU71_FOMSC|nr:hypothetical protein FOMPIDRAFT_91593 [Fomitopsis schrenkii]
MQLCRRITSLSLHVFFAVEGVSSAELIQLLLAAKSLRKVRVTNSGLTGGQPHHPSESYDLDRLDPARPISPITSIDLAGCVHAEPIQLADPKRWPNDHGSANRGARGAALGLLVKRDTSALPKAMGRPTSVQSDGHGPANHCPRGSALGIPRQTRAPQSHGLADVGADPWAWVGQPLPTRIRFGFSRASPKPWAGRSMCSPMGMGRPTAAHADPLWVYSATACSPNSWAGRHMPSPMGMGRPTVAHAYPPGHAGPTRQLVYHGIW